MEENKEEKYLKKDHFWRRKVNFLKILKFRWGRWWFGEGRRFRGGRRWLGGGKRWLGGRRWWLGGGRWFGKGGRRLGRGRGVGERRWFAEVERIFDRRWILEENVLVKDGDDVQEGDDLEGKDLRKKNYNEDFEKEKDDIEEEKEILTEE